MTKKIFTKEAPAAIGPYSQGMIAGNMIFTSGQIPADPVTGEFPSARIADQAERSILNVKAVLAAAGATLDDVVKTTCFLADMADFAEFNKVYEAYFKSCPARSCVAVKTIPKGALCEIEAVAVIERE